MGGPRLPVFTSLCVCVCEIIEHINMILKTIQFFIFVFYLLLLKFVFSSLFSVVMQ